MLRDSVRADLAKAFLDERQDLSVVEVGYRLAFSEPSAFHRAFRRWGREHPRGPLGSVKRVSVVGLTPRAARL
ncbi:MAG: hypothetical protein KC466_01840 [Myxococcales bacterium]|nr:hypothetical protein [Myxococcales bacterium]